MNGGLIDLLEEGFSVVELGDYQTFHLDVLDGWDEKASVSYAIECYERSVDYAAKNGFAGQLMLVLPFDYSETVEIDIPSSVSLVFEPPSIYMLAETAMVFDLSEEEYRRPVELVDVSADLPVRQFYRCFRSLEALENQWEFCRCLYLLCLIRSSET